VPNLFIERAKIFNKKALRAKKWQLNVMLAKKCIVYTFFESQKLSHPIILVPNRTLWALEKALLGKKLPSGTWFGTADLNHVSPQKPIIN
jgi:hypothetical protein